MTLRIDSHHHLWRYDPVEYEWIDSSMAALQRDFLSDELQREAASAGVVGTVAVQARQTVSETEDLLRIAEDSSVIRGVVGWLPVAAEDFREQLERSRGSSRLKGLRHVVQAEPEGFLLSADFNRGIRTMQGTGLTYDLLLRNEQLREAIHFVERHPRQIFVLDHLAKPAVGREGMREWAADIADLAKHQNVSCKLSGLVTEAEGFQWSPALVAPYLDVALSSFGPDRLMAGTDWPVLTVGCGYREWWETLEAWASPLSPAERAAILGGTAARVYSLNMDNFGEIA